MLYTVIKPISADISHENPCTVSYGHHTVLKISIFEIMQVQVILVALSTR